MTVLRTFVMSPFTSGTRPFRLPVSMLPSRPEEIHRAATRIGGTASTVSPFGRVGIYVAAHPSRCHTWALEFLVALRGGVDEDQGAHPAHRQAVFPAIRIARRAVGAMI